jgi:hypothetical protein
MTNQFTRESRDFNWGISQLAGMQASPVNWDEFVAEH